MAKIIMIFLVCFLSASGVLVTIIVWELHFGSVLENVCSNFNSFFLTMSDTFSKPTLSDCED